MEKRRGGKGGRGEEGGGGRLAYIGNASRTKRKMGEIYLRGVFD